MPRYSLRNQQKIKAHFEPHGDEILKRIIKSLDDHFENKAFLELNDSGDKHPGLIINDSGHTVNMIVFFVISITYDVYNLAFKEFIG